MRRKVFLALARLCFWLAGEPFPEKEETKTVVPEAPRAKERPYFIPQIPALPIPSGAFPISHSIVEIRQSRISELLAKDKLSEEEQKELSYLCSKCDDIVILEG